MPYAVVALSGEDVRDENGNAAHGQRTMDANHYPRKSSLEKMHDK
jgi:hypothetical protein